MEKPKEGAEFYLVWNCPHCGVVVPREAGSSPYCENCGGIAEPWIMTPDIQQEALSRE